MALTPEEIDYLTRTDKIKTSHLSQEARDFRDKYLRGVYRQNRLQREHARRKAEMSGERVKTYQYCDWSSDEEYQSWIAEDRAIRNKILDEVLADDNWLEILAKKYYGDSWQMVYADKGGADNWSRKELPKKKRLNTDEE